MFAVVYRHACTGQHSTINTPLSPSLLHPASEHPLHPPPPGRPLTPLSRCAKPHRLLGYYTLNCGLDAQAYHSHTKSSSSSSSSSASRFLDSLLGRLSPSPPPPRQPSGSSGSNGNGSNGSSAAEGGADWTPFADPSAVEDESPFATSAAAEAQGAAEPNPLEKALPKGDKTTPVMFLHGVGGLMLYLEMLKHVIALGHPVIVIEYKHVGMRLR